MKNLSPLQSVRKKCIECCNNQSTEIRLCPVKDCSLYFLRFGKKEKRVSTIKMIRAKCMDCGEGTWGAVKSCEHLDCPLYKYRLGKNPNIKRNLTLEQKAILVARLSRIREKRYPTTK